MPMRATTVRFSEDLWGLLERESREQGVSAAQFVRDATLLRIGALAGTRGDEEATRTIGDLAAGAAPETDPSAPAGPVIVAAQRLAAVERTGLLDAAPRDILDRLCRVATNALETPVALVSLVDADRQFFTSCIGLADPYATARQTALSHSFCQYAVISRRPLVIGDAREHPVLKRNPAIEDLGVVAYAGVPLIDDDGHALGTFCVIDHEPRSWKRTEIELLEGLARAALAEVTSAGAAQQGGGVSYRREPSQAV